MKRIHLFEFEDFAWFPNGLRKCMTRYIVAIHKMLGTPGEMAGLLSRALDHAEEAKVIDLCSGSGGPMPEVVALVSEQREERVKLTMTDLYPNEDAAREFNQDGNPQTEYLTTPVNAANMDKKQEGVRSMVCSLHHMKPAVARDILMDAQEARKPFLAFEISDNSAPKAIWWLAFPINILMVLFITPFVRPMSWQQLLFTYLIPVLPLVIAWDGSVSNARTYTLNDLDELLKGTETEGYRWEKGTIKGKMGKRVYILGLPQKS